MGKKGKFLHLTEMFYTTSGCDGCDKYEVWCFVEFWTVRVMYHGSGFICLCVPGWVFVYLSVTKKRLVESILNNWAGHEPSSWCTRTPGLLASAVYLITTVPVPVPVQSIWSEQWRRPAWFSAIKTVHDGFGRSKFVEIDCVDPFLAICIRRTGICATYIL